MAKAGQSDGIRAASPRDGSADPAPIPAREPSCLSFARHDASPPGRAEAPGHRPPAGPKGAQHAIGGIDQHPGTVATGGQPHRTVPAQPAHRGRRPPGGSPGARLPRGRRPPGQRRAPASPQPRPGRLPCDRAVAAALPRRIGARLGAGRRGAAGPVRLTVTARRAVTEGGARRPSVVAAWTTATGEPAGTATAGRSRRVPAPGRSCATRPLLNGTGEHRSEFGPAGQADRRREHAMRTTVNRITAGHADGHPPATLARRHQNRRVELDNTAPSRPDQTLRRPARTAHPSQPSTGRDRAPGVDGDGCPESALLTQRRTWRLSWTPTWTPSPLHSTSGPMTC